MKNISVLNTLGTFKKIHYCVSGKLYLWSLAKMFEASRVIALWTLLGLIVRTPDSSIFIANAVYEITPYFYEKQFNYNNSFGKNIPIKIVIYISAIGKTSYTNVTEWIDLDTGKLVARMFTKFVHVSTATRKPKPIPDVFKNSIEHHLKSLKDVVQLERGKPISVSENVFIFKIKPLHSDCDSNNHINQAIYVRWCSDAGSAAALNGSLKQYTKHIERYRVKSMDAHHLGEAVVGDIVDVCVWESGRTELTFVVRAGGITVYTLVMGFYEDEPCAVEPHLESKL